MKLHVGALVVCVKSNDKRYSFLVGAVGEIKEPLRGIVAKIFSADWNVDFPVHRQTPCPSCGKVHGKFYAMANNELKLIEDPDAGAVDTDKEIGKPEFGFVA